MPSSRADRNDRYLPSGLQRGELDELPIDCYTSGNHIWDKKEGLVLLEEHPSLLRPANYPDGNPGRGLDVGETAAGIPVATINLEGQVFMTGKKNTKTQEITSRVAHSAMAT